MKLPITWTYVGRESRQVCDLKVNLNAEFAIFLERLTVTLHFVTAFYDIGFRDIAFYDIGFCVDALPVGQRAGVWFDCVSVLVVTEIVGHPC